MLLDLGLQRSLIIMHILHYNCCLYCGLWFDKRVVLGVNKNFYSHLHLVKIIDNFDKLVH